MDPRHSQPENQSSHTFYLHSLPYHTTLDIDCQYFLSKTIDNAYTARYNDGMKQTIAVNVEATLVASLDKRAEDENRSRSNMIEEILKQYFKSLSGMYVPSDGK